MHFTDLLLLPSSIYMYLFSIYHYQKIFPINVFSSPAVFQDFCSSQAVNANLASLKVLPAANSVQKSHQPGKAAGKVQLKTVQKTCFMCDLSPALQ